MQRWPAALLLVAGGWADEIAPMVAEGLDAYNGAESAYTISDGTDTGAMEVGGFSPRMIITKREKHLEAPCLSPCAANEVCWGGRCMWRPWKLSQTPKFACYANPEASGVSKQDESICRADTSQESQAVCESRAGWCRWLSDSPGWYANWQEENVKEVQASEWHPENPQEHFTPVLKAVTENARPVSPLVDSVLSGKPYTVNPPWAIPPRAYSIGRSQQWPRSFGDDPSWTGHGHGQGFLQKNL